jgi:hypothetical protein
MSRIFVGMLGYNHHLSVEAGMKNFEEMVDPSHNIIKTLFTCGYPLPSSDENRLRLRELACKYGWWNPHIPNEGVMGNWNRAIHEHFHMENGDFLVTFDPDVRMRNKGWLPAMVEALRSDSQAMFCCASRGFHDEPLYKIPPYARTISILPSGVRVARWGCLVAWSMGVWKADFLITRPRNFSQSGKFYGYSEHADYERLVQHAKTWISVADYYDDHASATDPDYTQWKIESAAVRTDKEFSVWLKERGKL